MRIMDSRERSDTRGKTNSDFSKFFMRAKRAGPILHYNASFHAAEAPPLARGVSRGLSVIAPLIPDFIQTSALIFPPREHSNALEGKNQVSATSNLY